MRTKEIDVWVNSDCWKYDLTEIVMNTSEQPNYNMIKAKLTIELPEQKIEITESELERAIGVANFNLYIKDMIPNSIVEIIKKELGF